MATRTHRLSVFVAAAVEDVWGLLADPRHHDSLQPLIESVRVIEDRPSGVGEQSEVTFEIVERMTILWRTIEVRTRIVMARMPATREFMCTATFEPRGRMTARWSLLAREGGTQFDEQLTLHAPIWLVGYAFKRARQAHTAMLSAVVEHFAASAREASLVPSDPSNERP